MLSLESINKRSLVELSKTLVEKDTMAPYFSQFVATFVYCLWHDQSFSELSKSPTMALKEFSVFVNELLKVTKLSLSVLLLSLKYIHRIKVRCSNLHGRPGSEYRLIVCTLNLAMKYLIDNTYSNKTWYRLSKIPLIEINLAEMEFMAQLRYDLSVREEKYFSWLHFVDDAYNKFRGIIDVKMARHCITPPLEYKPSNSAILAK